MTSLEFIRAWRKPRTLNRLRGLPVAVTLLALLCWAGSASASNALRDISYSTLPGNEVQISLELAEAPESPSAFSIDDPARITFDFPDTRNELSERSLGIGVGLVEGVSTAEAAGRTRVVVRLARMMAYDTELDGNTFHIYLRDQSATAERAPARRATPSAQPTAAAVSIEDIDFRRGTDGAGLIQVDLSDEDAQVSLRREAGRIIVRMRNVSVPEELQRRLNVVDFATPVGTIETRQDGNDVRMVINPTGEREFEHMGYQSANRFTIELRPLTEREVAEREQEEFTGERLTLSFQDIEVRSVLQLIADFTGLNVVVSDSVTGNITLRLQNVPWDHALDIILRTRGLDKRIRDNVMLVAPAEEIAARERLEAESRQEMEVLAPLRSEFFQVNYARASDVASLLRSQDASLLSERGTVTIDQRTNVLIIRDTERNLSDIRDLLNRLDIPVRQVLIESRIVIANDDFSRELGVRFGASGQGSAGSRDGWRAGGTRPGGLVDGTAGFASGGAEGMLVDLPVSSPAGAVGLAVGRIGDRVLQLELSAMETEGRGEVVSSPRVITANQRTANIQQGVEIPYQEASASGATSVSFQEALLSLDVTPQITPDDRIIMDLAVNKDSVGQVFAGVPSIDTQAVTTQVLVDNGETVVLGGIYERERREEEARVPFFGSLPAVGWLFRNRIAIDQNSELLIFVTPRILEESLTSSSIN
ncbi:type IV pilus assembly protein PilQ [Natronocella acetinitrilica]|uniref:Type IV pilus assembly protein PilQ n=1 Tax=Natronocella acetinitrilica TaxID=414046 RepID=A0AAE3G7J7_9GAMM|nr:type IV pilus secretin PilQ family protein [Natronocella acetinitrilica]MCP1676877.1 type IV pilus assembly protein PilQ [Natronocella acetinitrilica]